MKKLIWKKSLTKSEIRTEDNFLRYVVNLQPSFTSKRTLEDNMGNTLAQIGEKVFSISDAVKFNVNGLGEGFIRRDMNKLGEGISFDLNFLGWDIQSMNIFSNMIVWGQDTIAYIKVKKGLLSTTTEITVYDETYEVAALTLAVALDLIYY